jgi:Ca2+-binding RTX toxin-like protein
VTGVDASGGLLNYHYDSEAIGSGAGYHHIVVRAVDHLDYTPGGVLYDANALNDRGGNDEIHGESGDDFVYGQSGNDVLFGEGQDDNLIGGTGTDWISGGTGNDGAIGDDGRIMTSRNSTVGEALNGVDGLLDKDPDPKNANGNVLDEYIKTPGAIQEATINLSGALKKAVNLTPFSIYPSWNGNWDEFVSTGPKQNDPFIYQDEGHYSDDIIFGGLGNDWLHGGSGDDAILGGEALSEAYTQVYAGDGTLTGVTRSDYLHPYNPNDALRYNPDDPDGWHYDRTHRAGEFALYDEYDPLRKITLNNDGSLNKSETGGLAWFLNFATDEGVFVPSGTIAKNTGNGVDSYPSAWSDGSDKIFGDLGNDWLVGGTGRDNLYGGLGNDLLNADDNQDTNGGLNDQPDTQPSYEDRAFGGGGRDVLIGNTGGDRLIDWVGEFNSYLVPYAPFGMASVSRTLQPQLAEFLYALSAGDGADPTRHADTGADAARNGEPEGELGVIRQKDYAWQDQTGAPTDPQAGNIPGGKRDVLRTANFNDGQMQALAADSGTWTVSSGTLQVSADSLHGDAVTVYQIGDALPSYYEVQASVQAGKPTGGWNANAFVIFDYQSETNFKFAGLDVSTNKLVMGHRDASGWVYDSQTKVKGGVKDGQWYNLLVAVNGLTATLVVDNATAFSHTYQPTVVDGWSYGLNWGLVGFGSNNAQGALDNIAVQVLPPNLTAAVSDSFDGTDSVLFAGGADVAGGSFSLNGGSYIGTPAGSEAVVSLAGLEGVTNLAANSILDLNATLNTTGRAGVVFDRYSDSDYKWAAVDVETQEVLLGHRKGDTWVIDAAVSKSLTAGSDYTLGVTLRGSTVSVTLDGQAAVGHVYNAVTVDGRFGMFGQGEVAVDSVTIKTDDPSVPSTTDSAQMLEAAQAAPAHTLGVATLTEAQLSPIMDQAVARWSLSEDAQFVAALRQADIRITDLSGLALGEYHDGVVYIDEDAAGYGWFIDRTPGDDREYRETDTGMLAQRGAAAGRMDLLSVVAHELGHAGGLAHQTDGVMAPTLAAGMRTVAGSVGTQTGSRNADPVIEQPKAYGNGVVYSGGAPISPEASASAPVPVIDWQSGYFNESRRNDETPTTETQDWQDDFVNHLGLGAEARNPNAQLKVYLPVASNVTSEVASSVNLL